jgi:hypothetical protein
MSLIGGQLLREILEPEVAWTSQTILVYGIMRHLSALSVSLFYLHHVLLIQYTSVPIINLFL